ncbi:MAG TPA: hypothetical protein VMG10_30945 [Gemmataceae bacterium]|nr:hypothetical protein [Gemmataceae bacterium]
MSEQEYPEYRAIAEDLVVLDVKFARVMARPRKGAVPSRLLDLLKQLDKLNDEMSSIKVAVESGEGRLPTEEERKRMLVILRNMRDCKREMIKIMEACK